MFSNKSSSYEFDEFDIWSSRRVEVCEEGAGCEDGAIVVADCSGKGEEDWGESDTPNTDVLVVECEDGAG